MLVSVQRKMKPSERESSVLESSCPVNGHVLYVRQVLMCAK